MKGERTQRLLVPARIKWEYTPKTKKKKKKEEEEERKGDRDEAGQDKVRGGK